MRLLLVSDLHYVLPQLDWVLKVAKQFDLVVIAGDMLDVSSPVAAEAQVAVMTEYIKRLGEVTTVLVGSGNHDLTGPDFNGEQRALWLDAVRELGVATDGDAYRTDDTLVTICPWWDGPLGRDAVADQLAHDAEQRPERWIWVYHWPPADSPTCWTGKRPYGDAELARWVKEYEPEVVLSGHVHHPPFTEAGHWADRIGRTWVFNAGRQIGRVPAHIEVDFAAGKASWSSMLGREELDLRDLVAPPGTAV